ncbi:MAG: rod shape-determining protein MreC [Burkholderiales bacterium RIFCSPLOWO2_02_FULL_57_36]|nr:MAG: rod shape-determining protein MreC [Burkholderiales bacterium RIFCSPLOWO2_02_FULL_57_36]
MEYSPPPLFKQGASARAKVVFFAMIAIALLVIDARMNTLTMIRQGVGVILYPLQAAALMPRDAAYAVGDYFSSLSSLQKENSELKRERVANAQALQQGQYLMAENAQLRALLAAAERLSVKSVMSEILYDTRDAFTRKIVVDRGAHHGITPGQPVIDDIGVVGQVTRVFPFTSEITLLTDKDFAIPVQVVRSGVRSIAYGRGQSGVLDLRFMSTNADVQKGDMLVTTGIDGVYPAGLSVASVTQVESESSDAFARIMCQPSAGIGRNKHLLILMPEAKAVPRSELEDAVEKKDKSLRKRSPEPVKDPAKATVAPETKAEPRVAPIQGAPAKLAPANAPAQIAPKPAASPAQAAPAPSVSVQAPLKPLATTQGVSAQATPKPLTPPKQIQPAQ